MKAKYNGNPEDPWYKTIPDKGILSNEVHVWRSFLDLQREEIEYLQEILSIDELDRASRMYFERDRNRFIASHGILRCILGFYLGKKPHEIQFQKASNGKPLLHTKVVHDNLKFNMSHSGKLALYSITHGCDVGIDIEQLRDDISAEQIAKRFFSSYEISLLSNCPEHKRNELFFQYWTRKEAFIKATGDGLSFPLDMVDVSDNGDAGFSPVIKENDNHNFHQWYWKDLFPGTGYVAALAIEGSDWDLSYWDCPNDSKFELV